MSPETFLPYLLQKVKLVFLQMDGSSIMNIVLNPCLFDLIPMCITGICY